MSWKCKDLNVKGLTEHFQLKFYKRLYFFVINKIHYLGNVTEASLSATEA